jgi:FMN phosphatase YigB (HAD superfamily)
MIDQKYIIFDWGDTLMKDDSTQTEPMYLWPEVVAVPGAEAALRALSKEFTISVATSAAHSDADMVRSALRRVGLESFVSHVFTGRAIGKKKTDPAFWSQIQHELEADPEDILVVGDSFESDVLTPVSVGCTAIWFNPHSRETKSGERYSTIHGLDELIGKAEPDSGLNEMGWRPSRESL